MDWLWPLYEEHIEREREREALPPGNEQARVLFLQALAESSATLFVMEPVGDSIRFKTLGRWPLSEVPDLLADPNGFIAARFGGGKYKVNFHHLLTFVGTHNFRTYGDPLWKQAPDLELE